MTLSSGLAAQIGWAVETTAGTYATPTAFAPLLSESIKFNAPDVVSSGLRAGRRTQQVRRKAGSWAEGSVSFELAPQGVGKLMRAMFGGVSTTGSSPYTHTFTPGALADDALTVQVGRPALGGTVHAFSYLGAQVTDWTIASTIDDFVMLDLSLYALHEVTSESLATATYPTGWAPFVFTEGSVSVASSDISLRSFSITGNNGLETGRHRISATTAARPKQSQEAGWRVYEGSLVADFESLTAYNRFVNGTEAALSIVISSGASASLTIAGNIRFTGETPVVSGPEILEQPLPFVFTSATSDAAAITATLVNTDATP